VKPSSKRVVRLYEVRKRHPREDAVKQAQSSGLEPLQLLVATKLVKSTLKISKQEVSCCFDVMARSYCGGLLNTLTCSKKRDNNIQGWSSLASQFADWQFDDWLSHDYMFSALRTKATCRPFYDVG
jgi:hypothetical protein